MYENIFSNGLSFVKCYLYTSNGWRKVWILLHWCLFCWFSLASTMYSYLSILYVYWTCISRLSLKYPRELVLVLFHLWIASRKDTTKDEIDVCWSLDLSLWIKLPKGWFSKHCWNQVVMFNKVTTCHVYLIVL